MKKILPFIFIVLLASGAFYFYSSGKKDQSSLKEKMEEVVEEKKEQVKEKIKDLIAQNIPLKCIYEIERTKVTTYVKGENRIRTIVETKEGEINQSIFANNKIYFWNPKRKEGIVMSIDFIKSQQNKMPKSKILEKQIEEPEKQIEKMEKFKAHCQRENFSDSIFQPPTGVKFQDFDKLQEMMQQGNFQMPIFSNPSDK